MEFRLTREQIQKFQSWSKKFKSEYTGTIGGGFTFSFTPTGLGMVVKVKHFRGEELDLTEYYQM